jgi:tRNA pseudouridine32 synthase / 23S rRNA pseudouridine746 synthase
MNCPLECKVVVTDATRDARDLLVEASELSASRVSVAMASGAVWLQTQFGVRRLRRRSAKLSEGDQLFLNYDETVLSQTAAPAELIKDGGRWSVWNKPAGMRAQGSKWGDHTTLGRYAEKHLDPRRESFIVHRLDLAARGLMLLAHDKKAAASLAGQFAERTVGKRYHAIVHGKFPGRDEAQVYTGLIDGKTAATTASRIRFDPQNNCSVLLVSIRTGRKHQIRRHLADAGFPIIGDRLHGRAENLGSELKLDPNVSLCLVASRLSFDDPLTGARVKCECIPQEWL